MGAIIKKVRQNLKATQDRQKVYVRNNTFQNEVCAYATTLTLQTDPTQSSSAIFLNYEASETSANLLLDNSTFTTVVTASGFYSNIHNKAQFFNVQKNEML